ncbi:hypothetical protein [Plantibacter sp. PA-3-X8]|uniref:hypothetical protein n=1 Tax=Plantibacter sp. PA-3-X8 TaxID=2480625 RepID=UPI0013DE3F06|nr:hypothetical protein [Plantibacter sp. PA-3-X8]
MLTSATHSSAMTGETRRFVERELQQRLERERERRERLLDATSGEHGARTRRTPLHHRLRAALGAFVATLRDADRADDARRAPVSAHR